MIFNHPVFFVRDVAEYRSNFAAQAQGKKALAFFSSIDPRSWELRHLFIALQTLAPAPESPVATTYSSVAPYKLGPHNIKYRVIPTPENCPTYQLPEQNRDLPNFLRSALYQQLSLDRAPACFALQVQRQNAEHYMPIEDTSIEWDEAIAPFETVADIRLLPQDFDSPEQNLACDNLSFNPWHALPEHRPIGGINRLRKAVYEAISSYRLERNGARRHHGGPWISSRRAPPVADHGPPGPVLPGGTLLASIRTPSPDIGTRLQKMSATLSSSPGSVTLDQGASPLRARIVGDWTLAHYAALRRECSGSGRESTSAARSS